MTASELIEQLQDVDPDTEVMVYGYEWGCHSTIGVKCKEVALDYHENDNYGGPHQHLDYFESMLPDEPDNYEQSMRRIRDKCVVKNTVFLVAKEDDE